MIRIFLLISVLFFSSTAKVFSAESESEVFWKTTKIWKEFIKELKAFEFAKAKKYLSNKYVQDALAERYSYSRILPIVISHELVVHPTGYSQHHRRRFFEEAQDFVAYFLENSGEFAGLPSDIAGAVTGNTAYNVQLFKLSKIVIDKISSKGEDKLNTQLGVSLTGDAVETITVLSYWFRGLQNIDDQKSKAKVFIEGIHYLMEKGADPYRYSRTGEVVSETGSTPLISVLKKQGEDLKRAKRLEHVYDEIQKLVAADPTSPRGCSELGRQQSTDNES